MSIERLVASLEQEAERDAAARLEAAHARAGAILADADAQAAARRRDFFSEREPALRREVMRRIALARRDCTTAILTVRQSVLDRVFARTAELLATPEALGDYARGSPARLEAALAYLDDRPAIVRCPPSIADSVRAVVDRRPTLALEPDPEAAPGLIVRTTDGRLVIDDALLVRLERLRPQLASIFVRRLDGQP